MHAHDLRRKIDRPRTLHRQHSYLNSPVMPYQSVTLAVDGGIATLTINRPDKLNALNAATMAELGSVMDEVRDRDDILGLIVTGAGRAFVAGADISELAAETPVSARALAIKGQRIFRRFETSPKPVIAAVNGFAFGGGCELALACHIRIASEQAKFGQPEVKLGICPGYGGTQRLARLVGKGRALQLLLTGEAIDAAEAYRLGLVNRVVAADSLLESAVGMLRQILANGPLAVAACIEAVELGLDMSLEGGLALEASHFGLLAATADMREGTRAFLERRAAEFKGT
jgi:enoyl-CoA hydratase